MSASVAAGVFNSVLPEPTAWRGESIFLIGTSVSVVDIFLYDLKETDSVRHREYTGVPLPPILDNLTALTRAGAKIVLRCPIIPGLNGRDEHFHAIAEIARQHPQIMAINLMPYHPLGESKARRIGKNSALSNLSFPDSTAVAMWIETIQATTAIPVTQG